MCYIPQFNHNLLSICKLSQDCKYEVMFGPGGCVISDSVSKNVVGVGEIKQGLYYLMNEKLAVMQAVTWGDVQRKVTDEKKKLKGKSEGQYDLWYKRLGHASHSKMQHIPLVRPYLSQHKDQVCITCPLSRMTKLVFPSSKLHAEKPFDLIHVDIWGPYRVCTRGKFRFFNSS